MGSNSADILHMEAARAKRQDFAANTGFDTAGAFLKNVREEKGLSLEQISDSTHIKTDHIHAIECGDLSALPARPYVSGFVKTYAEYLELEPAPIVARFREDVGLQQPIPLDAQKFETAEVKASAEKREMSLLAVLVVVVFFLWCAWQIVTPKDPVPLDGPLPELPVEPFTQAKTAVLDPLNEVSNQPQLPNAIPARISERVVAVYPRLCEGRAAPVESVEVSFNITADGRVAGAHILSSTNDCFNRSALNAIKRWRFTPRQVEGGARPTYDQVWTFAFKKPA